MKTRASSMRLDSEDLAALDKIMEMTGLKSRADAVRVSAYAYYRQLMSDHRLVIAEKKLPEKSRKRG